MLRRPREILALLSQVRFAAVGRSVLFCVLSITFCAALPSELVAQSSKSEPENHVDKSDAQAPSSVNWGALLDAESSTPAQQLLQKSATLQPLLALWPSLSPRAKVRALRIAKLHRDADAREALTKLACADAHIEVRKACIEVAGPSVAPAMQDALLAAAGFDDTQGDRAARLIASRASVEHLPALLQQVAAAPERSAITHAAAKVYWRAVARGTQGNELEALSAPAMQSERSRARLLLALAKQRPDGASDPGALLRKSVESLPPSPSFEHTYLLLKAAASLDEASETVDRWVEGQHNDKLWMIRRAAIDASASRLLARDNTVRAATLLRAALDDPSPRVRVAVLARLQAMPEETARRSEALLVQTLQDEPWPIVRAQVARNMAAQGMFEETARLLGDPARRVRAQAMRLLAQAPRKLQIAATEHVLRRDPEWPQVQMAALDVIESACLPVLEPLAAFVRREDKRAKRLSSDDALRKAIVVYAKLSSEEQRQALLTGLRSSAAQATAKAVLQDKVAFGCEAKPLSDPPERFDATPASQQ